MIHLAYSPASAIEVDRDNGIIKGVAVITAGIVAQGHNAPPFATDRVLLQQVADAINAQSNGVKSRMGHAEVEEVDGLHVMVGKIRNARVDGDVVRADFYAGKGADKDAIERLFWLAEDAPEDAGLSIVPADYEFIEENGELHLRVQSMFAVDWVGVPAANLAGMLSKTNLGATPRKAIAMSFNESQIAFLKGIGLAEGASEEDMQKMVEGLDEENKSAFAALMDPAPTEPVEEVPAESAAAAPVAASKKQAKPALAAAEKPATLEEIEEYAALSGLKPEWTLATFKLNKPAAEVRKLALAAKVKQTGASTVPHITVGEDQNRASLSAAMPQAIMLRAGYKVETPHARAKELSGLSVLDMARHHYAALGVRDAFMLSRAEICNMISRRYFAQKYPALSGAQGSSSFDSILADTQNKTLRQAYAEAPATWSIWAKRNTTPDFKLTRRTALLDLPTLNERVEGQGLDYVALSDSGESFYMKEYHGGVRLTRVALINDDLSAFSDVTRKMGNAAKRLEDDAAYAAISGVGPTMGDTGALFNATAVTTAGGHANYTSSGTAINTTSLGIGFGQMYVQKGGKNGAGSALEIRPKFLIVASQIEYIARQAISSTELLTSEALTSAGVMKGTSNPFKDTVTVIPTTRLATTFGGSTASSTAWVLAADPNQIDTVEVCFLQGEEEPVLTQETDFDTDDMKFKVRHAVRAIPLDFRGLYKNVGA